MAGCGLNTAGVSTFGAGLAAGSSVRTVARGASASFFFPNIGKSLSK
jgi:hypothetical protein